MAAEHVMLEHVLGIADAGRMRKIADVPPRTTADRRIMACLLRRSRRRQRYEPRHTLRSSSPALTRRRRRCVRARDFVRAHGGIGATRVFTKLWLALFGQFDWDALPAMPPEAILFPVAIPLQHLRVRFMGARDDGADPRRLGEAAGRQRSHRAQAWQSCTPIRRDRAAHRSSRATRARSRGATSSSPPIALLGLHERSPWKPLRQRAHAACERWIVDHQEADGSWGGIQPPWVYSLIALKCLGLWQRPSGHGEGDRAVCSASFALETDETFTVQPCVSPVWDTALAVTGMREAGVPADDAALLRVGTLDAAQGDPRAAATGA